MNSVSRYHKGCTYYASSEEELNNRIERADYDRSIFYRSSVYIYSCYARELDDRSIELTEYFNNGETKKVSKFESKKEFWNSKG